MRLTTTLQASACVGCPNQNLCASGAAKGPDPGRLNPIILSYSTPPSTNISIEHDKDIGKIVENLRNVKHKILVLSGKGGVGKSTVSSQLALALAMKDLSIGLMDIDICGPSIPKIMGVEG